MSVLSTNTAPLRVPSDRIYQADSTSTGMPATPLPAFARARARAHGCRCTAARPVAFRSTAVRTSLLALMLAAVLFVLAPLLSGATSGACFSTQALAEETQAVTGSAIDEDANLGINDYKRLDTGTSRKGDGIEYGYRFTQDDNTNAVVFAMEDEIILMVPQAAADAIGLDSSDTERCAALMQLIEDLDASFSSGSTTIASLGLEATVVVGQDSYTSDVRTYEINVPGAKTNDDGSPAYYYSIISRSDDEKPQTGKVVVGICHIVSASETQMEAVPTWWDNITSFLADIDYRPLWVSLKTSGVALAFVFVLGIYAAYKSMGVKSRWKGIVDSLFTIPMVLPPTVVGFILLLTFGQSTGFGRFLIEHGIKLVFSWPSAVMAATVVAFPLMYRTARGAFEGLDTNMLDAARTLGWTEGQIFRKLMVPLAWPSIAAGTVLAFARAMGEFGATLFVAGNYAGITQTMPVAIYFQWMAGNTDVALFWVVIVILISFLVILIINVYTAHSQRYRASGRMSRRERRLLEREAAQFDEAAKAAAAPQDVSGAYNSSGPGGGSMADNGGTAAGGSAGSGTAAQD